MLIYSFVKLNLSWYFSSWNLLHVGFSSRNMMHADFCSWNLLHVECFFKKLNVSWFIPSRKLLYFYFSSWELLHVDFSLRETCRLIFNLMKLVLFLELVSWFCSVNWVHFDLFLCETCCMLIYSFLKLHCIMIFSLLETLYMWFFSLWNLFCWGTWLPCWFLFIELVACAGLFLQETCWMPIISWNLCIDFSPRWKLLTVLGTSLVLTFVRGT